MSYYERTGFRDTERISTMHRTLGNELTCIDFDFILVEANSLKPSAFVEYKLRNDVRGNVPDVKSYQYRLLGQYG